MGAQESSASQYQPEKSIALDKSLVDHGTSAKFLKKVETSAYGEVKIYTDKSEKNVWAVKQKLFTQKEDYEDYMQLAERLREIDSPYLVTLLRVYKTIQTEYCSSFFRVYLAFEYYKTTLKDQIFYKQKNKLDYSEGSLYKIMIQTTIGINYMQGHQIYHENICPANIVIDNQQKIYKITNQKFMRGSYTMYQSLLFGLNDVCYLAPELFDGLKRRERNPDHDKGKTEIFSIGLCILEAATFQNVQELYDFEDYSFNVNLLNGYIMSLEHKYSEGFIQNLKRMLAVNPDDRISLTQLEDELWDFKKSQICPENIQNMFLSKDNTFITDLQRSQADTIRPDQSRLLKSQLGLNTSKKLLNSYVQPEQFKKKQSVPDNSINQKYSQVISKYVPERDHQKFEDLNSNSINNQVPDSIPQKQSVYQQNYNPKSKNSLEEAERIQKELENSFKMESNPVTYDNKQQQQQNKEPKKDEQSSYEEQLNQLKQQVQEQKQEVQNTLSQRKPSFSQPVQNQQRSGKNSMYQPSQDEQQSEKLKRTAKPLKKSSYQVSSKNSLSNTHNNIGSGELENENFPGQNLVNKNFEDLKNQLDNLENRLENMNSKYQNQKPGQNLLKSSVGENKSLRNSTTSNNANRNQLKKSTYTINSSKKRAADQDEEFFTHSQKGISPARQSQKSQYTIPTPQYSHTNKQ